MGVAIVPEETVLQEVANRTLTAVKLEGNYHRELGVIYKKDKVLSPAMKAFIELLKA
jgi:DNA-binding transcriptional LysR family regulator